MASTPTSPLLNIGFPSSTSIWSDLPQSPYPDDLPRRSRLERIRSLPKTAPRLSRSVGSLTSFSELPQESLSLEAKMEKWTLEDGKLAVCPDDCAGGIETLFGSRELRCKRLLSGASLPLSKDHELSMRQRTESGFSTATTGSFCFSTSSLSSSETESRGTTEEQFPLAAFEKWQDLKKRLETDLQDGDGPLLDGIASTSLFPECPSPPRAPAPAHRSLPPFAGRTEMNATFAQPGSIASSAFPLPPSFDANRFRFPSLGSDLYHSAPPGPQLAPYPQPLLIDTSSPLALSAGSYFYAPANAIINVFNNVLPPHMSRQSLPSSARKPMGPASHNKKGELYKTELCRSFSDTNTCRYNHRCQYAHGLHELRPVPSASRGSIGICKVRDSGLRACLAFPRCRS